MTSLDSDNETSASSSYDKHLKLQERAIELLRLSDNTYLGCRDVEAATLHDCIKSAATKNLGGSIFLFGLSGSGKSTTANHVLKQYKLENPDVHIVCLTGSAFNSNYSVLQTIYRNILGVDPKKRVGFKHKGLKHIDQYKGVTASLKLIFHSAPNYTIFLMDEVDYICSLVKIKDRSSKCNWMIQAILEAANSQGSKVLFIAISNNLDQATKITERQCRIIMFKPYNENQIMTIIKGKLEQLDQSYTSVIDDTAILLLARRVANTTGDIRACLDTFARAISTSMSNLEGKLENLYAESTTYSPSNTPERSTERFTEESETPMLPSSDTVNNSLELKGYQVGHKEVGSLTPTLTLNILALLKQKIKPLPLMQLVTLLAIAKSSMEEQDCIVSIKSVKKSLIHLADVLMMYNVDIEDFCTSGFNDAIDVLKELQIIAKVDKRSSSDDSPREEE
ncbi:cell division control protein 6-related protein [Babesia gibsoni]|uniref:Cell division control protein 6-related protein n=1 Tax=Babesia gibsoni TaxID=33632 RepID=A0AAD8PED8_BABGI|nr:cell division control protein 6-related protein [Babesia gibsoni]